MQMYIWISCQACPVDVLMPQCPWKAPRPDRRSGARRMTPPNLQEPINDRSYLPWRSLPGAHGSPLWHQFGCRDFMTPVPHNWPGLFLPTLVQRGGGSAPSPVPNSQSRESVRISNWFPNTAGLAVMRSSRSLVASSSNPGPAFTTKVFPSVLLT